MKLVITGYPKTGKTTLANQFESLEVKHTDDLIGVENNIQLIMGWFEEDGDWIVEGVEAVRAIKEWLAANPMAQFPAEVVYLTEYMVDWPNTGRLVKGLDTMWKQIRSRVRVLSYNETIRRL